MFGSALAGLTCVALIVSAFRCPGRPVRGRRNHVPRGSVPDNGAITDQYQAAYGVEFGSSGSLGFPGTAPTRPGIRAHLLTDGYTLRGARPRMYWARSAGEGGCRQGEFYDPAQGFMFHMDDARASLSFMLLASFPPGNLRQARTSRPRSSPTVAAGPSSTTSPSARPKPRPGRPSPCRPTTRWHPVRGGDRRRQHRQPGRRADRQPHAPAAIDCAPRVQPGALRPTRDRGPGRRGHPWRPCPDRPRERVDGHGQRVGQRRQQRRAQQYHRRPGAGGEPADTVMLELTARPGQAGQASHGDHQRDGRRDQRGRGRPSLSLTFTVRATSPSQSRE